MKTEVRAVWIPFMDFREILTGKSKSEFEKAFCGRMDTAAEWGINRVFVHLRPFGDALYPSAVFPASHLISGEEGVKPAFDPLDVMLRAVHERGMELDAWINPFRVRAPGVAKAGAGLCPDNPALRMRDPLGIIEYRNSITYNPASEEACSLILSGLRELVDAYPVDGIHFDDYFYPFSDTFFDMDSYCAYKLPGGGLSQAAWRRQNVSLFLRECHKTIHGSGCGRFGISPKGYMPCNTDEEFLDVPRILSEPGYVDYVCPQAYFALNDEICPFSSVMEQYDTLITADIQLLAGLAVYKLGFDDRWAGEAGRREWLEGVSLLADMVTVSRGCKSYGGFSLYNFQTAFLPQAAFKARVDEEMSALRRILS